MTEPINICPHCHAPFTKGQADIASSDDIAKHYWWHLLETSKAPVLKYPVEEE